MILCGTVPKSQRMGNGQVKFYHR